MHRTRNHRLGFTLIELLTVIGIIGLLAALLFPAVTRARRKAGESACLNNLHQISLALTMYQDDHNGQTPPWLSALFPHYLDSPDVLICKADDSHGVQGSKPDGVTQVGTDYTETDDTESNPHPDRNPDIKACSYLYEFCAAECSWLKADPTYLNATAAELDSDGNGIVSWGEAKVRQLTYGDAANGFQAYGEVSFPEVRCFHHWNNRSVPSTDPSESGYLTLNVAFSGNVFEAPITWENKVP